MKTIMQTDYQVYLQHQDEFKAALQNAFEAGLQALGEKARQLEWFPSAE